ncbi:hypothetical protein C2E23DRAFT_867507 [Lenzites betulinus]|nr:hypothetical protein C2E23DRAFT_867507 [Lenzites betulinus]
MYAVARALCAIPPFAPAHIVSDSRFVTEGLTKHLSGWEDRGWLGITNPELVKDVVGILRARSAPTTFRWVKGHSGIEGNEAADALAEEGRALPVTTCPDLIKRRRPGFVASGARLRTITQKLAYKSIMRTLPQEPRRSTYRMVHQVLASLAEIGCHPSEEKLWKSACGQDVRQNVRGFWWRALHGALRIGHFWDNIPGYEHRALCRKCDVPETLEHILLECAEPGQDAAWVLARCALRRKGISLPSLTIGIVLGALCLDRDAQKNTLPTHDCRFVKIVVSETVHIIWKLRCKRVIEPDSCRPEELSQAGIEKQWWNAMNKRLQTDQYLTSRALGKLALAKTTVLRTWDEVLEDRQALPDNWIFCAGVLVGKPRSLMDGDHG